MRPPPPFRQHRYARAQTRCRTSPWSCAARTPPRSWQAGNRPDPRLYLGCVGDVAVSDAQFANFDVARREPGATEVYGSEILARIERNRRLRRLILEVGQQLELDDRRGNSIVRDPAPDPGVLRREAGSAECPLKPRGVHGPTGDLEVDLHVYIDRPRVLETTFSAQQFRDQPPEHNELRPFPIVVDDADERPLRRFPCRSGAQRWLIDHVSPPGDARRPLRPARRRREDRRRRGAMERDATRFSLRPAARP